MEVFSGPISLAILLGLPPLPTIWFFAAGNYFIALALASLLAMRFVANRQLPAGPRHRLVTRASFDGGGRRRAVSS